MREVFLLAFIVCISSTSASNLSRSDTSNNNRNVSTLFTRSVSDTGTGVNGTLRINISDSDGTIVASKVPTMSISLPELISFGEFIIYFNKMYTPLEKKIRRIIYERNFNLIKKHNLDPASFPLRFGINTFSDLTPIEFHLLISRRMPPRPKVRSMGTSTRLVETNVTAIDWRTKGAVTGVKAQGTCGACWAFATTGAVEGAYKIATGTLRSVSEQQILDCNRNSVDKGCDGGTMVEAYTYIKNNKGIDSESDYKYTGDAAEPCSATKQKRAVAQISGFANVVADNEQQLAAAVALQPVSVAIEADQATFQHYRSGVISDNCGTQLNHAVLVVGFTPDYWILKNSWGTDWGEQGYFRIARDSPVNGNKGVCGIAMTPSYPLVPHGPPLPPSPPSPPPSPPPPCPGCTPYCAEMCAAKGFYCCHMNGSCMCSKLDKCCS
eukprot:m.70690 g.70690  ORF g.70690 m.70690 type:complete len:438 (-) comp24260_c0_seq4:207-1520(-)